MSVALLPGGAGAPHGQRTVGSVPTGPCSWQCDVAGLHRRLPSTTKTRHPESTPQMAPDRLSRPNLPPPPTYPPTTHPSSPCFSPLLCFYLPRRPLIHFHSLKEALSKGRLGGAARPGLGCWLTIRQVAHCGGGGRPGWGGADSAESAAGAALVQVSAAALTWSADELR